MSSIRDTALEAFGGRLPRGTGTRAQAALDALEAREQAIFTDLVDAAVDFGVSRDQAVLALTNVGLSAPVVAEAAPEDRITNLERMVASALDWARTKGYRG